MRDGGYEISVTGATDERLQAKHVIVATGTRSSFLIMAVQPEE